MEQVETFKKNSNINLYIRIRPIQVSTQSYNESKNFI